jgi:FKBP-type peptidyl-prolyl cis-trans isomerase (trigger factor)
MNTQKTTENKHFTKADIKKVPGSQVEITCEISKEVLNSFREKALKTINESISIDGFRKGFVPENILINKVGEMTILEEMAEMAISRAYTEIILENKIDAIGRPQVNITKIAIDNPLEFKITVAVMPEIKLPDYKKIAEKQISEVNPDETKVTDKDIEDAILRIRKSHVSHEGHDHEKMTPEEHDKAIMQDLPEWNDDFVKKLGDFKDIPDFRNKLSLMLEEEKKSESKDRLRMKIAEAIAEKTEVELPQILIDSELDRTEAQFKADIERMGVKMEDYLKHAKKTIEEIRKEWQPHAEKKSKVQMILNKISILENIKPSEEDIKKEVDHIVEHYKDADRESATTYAETVLTNDKVFAWLENGCK